MSSQPRVFAIIPTYNSDLDLERCVESLQQAEVHQIIIVDSASQIVSDVSRSRIMAGAKNVQLHPLPNNVGFGAAVNFGALAAGYREDDLLLVMNPDIVLEPFALKEMVAFLDQHPSSIVSPRILTGSGRKSREWSGESHIDSRAGRVSLRNSRTPAVGGGPDTTPITFVVGATFMLGGRTWLELEGFREDFFLYWEDADLSMRALKKGIEMWGLLHTTAWHRVGASRSKEDSLGGRPLHYFYYMARNRLWLFLPELSLSRLMLGRGFLPFVYPFFRALRDGKGSMAKLHAAAMGVADGVSGDTRHEAHFRPGIERN